MQKNKVITFNRLSGKALANAIWEMNQRNKVSEYQGLKVDPITMFNSKWYLNGVYAGKVLN